MRISTWLPGIEWIAAQSLGAYGYGNGYFLSYTGKQGKVT